MQAFSTARVAKEYLVAQIVMEAERKGVFLSETERKMMYFTETAWTLPDIWDVNEVFQRDYDQPSYEAKIQGLARDARAYVDRMNQSSVDIWKEAVQTLRREDHYLLVLLEEPKAPRVCLLGIA